LLVASSTQSFWDKFFACNPFHTTEENGIDLQYLGVHPSHFSSVTNQNTQTYTLLP
jgi:hypothetical protein